MTGIEANPAGKGADSQLMAEPSAETPHEGRKRPTLRNYLITAALILLVAWQLGLIGAVSSFISMSLMSPQPKPLPQNFNILVPDFESTLDPATGVANLRFFNSGNSAVEITGIEVTRIDGKKCQLTTKLPLKAASGEKIGVTASGCQEAGEKKMGRIAVNIQATTSLKSKALAESSSAGPLPAKGLPEGQQIEFRKVLEAELSKLNNSDQPIRFVSSGTLMVSYRN